MVEVSSTCCDCKALKGEVTEMKRNNLMDARMFREIKADVDRVCAEDVFSAGVIRWVSASMRSDLYDSF